MDELINSRKKEISKILYGYSCGALPSCGRILCRPLSCVLYLGKACVYFTLRPIHMVTIPINDGLIKRCSACLYVCLSVCLFVCLLSAPALFFFFVVSSGHFSSLCQHSTASGFFSLPSFLPSLFPCFFSLFETCSNFRRRLNSLTE